MFTKENALVAVMTLTMLSVIGFAVSLFAGAFFVKEIGVQGAIGLVMMFAIIAVVGQCVVDKLENI